MTQSRSEQPPALKACCMMRSASASGKADQLTLGGDISRRPGWLRRSSRGFGGPIGLARRCVAEHTCSLQNPVKFCTRRRLGAPGRSGRRLAGRAARAERIHSVAHPHGGMGCLYILHACRRLPSIGLLRSRRHAPIDWGTGSPVILASLYPFPGRMI